MFDRTASKTKCFQSAVQALLASDTQYLTVVPEMVSES